MIDDQNAVSPEPTPPERTVGEILNDSHSGEAASTEKPESRQGQPEAQPSDNERGGRDDSWTYKAMKKERATRQALASRVKELESELQTERMVRDYETQQQYEQPQPQQAGDDFWMNPEFALKDHLFKTNLRASMAEFVAEHGRAAYAAYDRAAERAQAANDPDIPLLGEKMHGSHDPVAVAVEWFNTRGAKYMDQQPNVGNRRDQVFPTAGFANTRNVGARRGPEYGGQQSLTSIFATAKQRR